MIEEAAFKSNFVGRDGFRWFIAQVAPSTKQSKQREGGWGNRYKIRIMGYHPFDATITDEDLPYAHVLMPPTAGSGAANTSESCMIRQGDVVFGFFLDGDDGQLPVILGLFGRTPQVKAGEASTEDTQGFKPFTGYTDEIVGTSKMGQEEANDNQGVVNLPAARNPKNSHGGVVDGLLGGNLTDQLESVSGALDGALGAVSQGMPEVSGVSGQVTNVVSNAGGAIRGATQGVLSGSSSVISEAISGAVTSAAAGDLLGAATQALKATEAATGIIASIGQDAATLANNIKSFASISNANLAQYITQPGGYQNQTSLTAVIPSGNDALDSLISAKNASSMMARNKKSGAPQTDSLANGLRVEPAGGSTAISSIDSAINNTVTKLQTTRGVYDSNKEIARTAEKITKVIRPMIEIALKGVNDEVTSRTPDGLEKQYKLFYEKKLNALYYQALGITTSGIGQFQGGNTGITTAMKTAAHQAGLDRQLEFEDPIVAFEEAQNDILQTVEDDVTSRMKTHVARTLRFIAESPADVPKCVAENLMVRATVEIGYGLDEACKPYLIPLEPINGLINITDRVWSSESVYEPIEPVDGAPNFGIVLGGGGYTVPVVDKDRVMRVTPIAAGESRDKQLLFQNETPYSADPTYDGGVLGKCYTGPPVCSGLIVEIVGGNATKNATVAPIFERVPTEEEVGQFAAAVGGTGVLAIQVVDPGEGYKKTPKIVVKDHSNQGFGCIAEAKIDFNTGSPTYGQLLRITVKSPGQSYPPNVCPETITNDTPNRVIRIGKEGGYINTINIVNMGSNYKVTDKFNTNALKPVISLGKLVGADILEPLLYDELPDIKLVSDTGKGAKIYPILDNQEPVETYGYRRIIDCVGYWSTQGAKIPVGFVNGRPYYGAYHSHSNGILMTGQVHTKFSVIIYTTPDASIANMDEIPDASTVAGAASSADQVVLPLTGTEAATTTVMDNVLDYGTSLQDAVSSQSGFSADPTTTTTSSSGGTQTTTTQSSPPSSSPPSSPPPSPPSSGGGGGYGGGY